MVLPLFFCVFLIPLVQTETTFDHFYTLGWLLLSLITLLLIAFQIIQVDLKRLGFLAVLLFAVLISSSSFYTEDVLHAGVIALLGSAGQINNSTLRSIKRSAVLVWFVLVATYLWSALFVVAEEGYSHQSTYLFADFFANRNLICEYVVILTILIAAIEKYLSCKFSKLTLILALSVLLIVLVSQAKAALFSACILLAYLGWYSAFKRPFLWIIGFLLVSLLSVNAYSFYLQTQNKKGYTEYIEGLPDIAKLTDISYNMGKVESSSERQAIWKWTLANTQWTGKGIGSWKFDVQGNVGFDKYDCKTILRRPHNELVKMGYELGWLVAAVLLIVLVLVSFNPFLLILLPLVLFSFPTERAEFIFPLIVLFNLKKGGYQWSGLRWFKASYFTGMLCAILLLMGTFFNHQAHSIYSDLAQYKIKFKELSESDAKLLDWFPYDFMLNHAQKYEALHLLKANRVDEAVPLLLDVYQRDPNFFTNYQLLQRALEQKGVTIHNAFEYPCNPNQSL